MNQNKYELTFKVNISLENLKTKIEDLCSPYISPKGTKFPSPFILAEKNELIGSYKVFHQKGITQVTINLNLNQLSENEIEVKVSSYSQSIINGQSTQMYIIQNYTDEFLKSFNLSLQGKTKEEIFSHVKGCLGMSFIIITLGFSLLSLMLYSII